MELLQLAGKEFCDRIRRELEENHVLQLVKSPDGLPDSPSEAGSIAGADLVVTGVDNNQHRVTLSKQSQPKLRVNPHAESLLTDDLSSGTLNGIHRKVESARWLIESIENRYYTLRKVAQEIIDHQQDFLDKGPGHIHPLKMQQIADRIGVQVTTVSRAVDGKWIQTPHGLVLLKRFFFGETQTAESEEVALDTIPSSRLEPALVLNRNALRLPFEPMRIEFSFLIFPA